MNEPIDRVVEYAAASGYVNVSHDARLARVQLADLRRKAHALDSLMEYSLNVVCGDKCRFSYSGRGHWYAGPSIFTCDWRHDTPLEAIETAVERLEQKEQADGE